MNQWKVIIKYYICSWSRCRREPRCRWRKSHRCSQPAGEEMVVDIEKCKGLRIRRCTQVSQYRMLKVQRSTKVSQAGQATPGGRRGWRCRAPPRCRTPWGWEPPSRCSWSCQGTPHGSATGKHLFLNLVLKMQKPTLEMRRVPMPEPVPPPREWVSWKPCRQSHPSASFLKGLKWKIHQILEY